MTGAMSLLSRSYSCQRALSRLSALLGLLLIGAVHIGCIGGNTGDIYTPPAQRSCMRDMRTKLAEKYRRVIREAKAARAVLADELRTRMTSCHLHLGVS